MLPAFASTPADSGTLAPSSTPGVVSSGWTGTIAGANPNSDCSQTPAGATNDHHTFTLSVPANFYPTHTVKMEISETATAADSILTVAGPKGSGSSDNGSVGGSESKTILDPPSGTYDAITCAFAGASPYTASVTLTTAMPTPVTTTGGTSTTAGPSSYGNYPLAAIPGSAKSGEPSIGVDWGTGNVYFQANLNTIKAKFPSYGASPTLTDVSCLATSKKTLDPIMYTDSQTGRTGVSQLLVNPLGRTASPSSSTPLRRPQPARRRPACPARVAVSSAGPITRPSVAGCTPRCFRPGSARLARTSTRSTTARRPSWPRSAPVATTAAPAS